MSHLSFFYIERIIELMVKIIKSEKLMALKSNLSIYSIFMCLLIQLALQCGRFYTFKALNKIGLLLFVFDMWLLLFYSFSSFSFVLRHEFTTSVGQIDQSEIIVSHLYSLPWFKKFDVSTNQILIFITRSKNILSLQI